jgi:hypothetical protein
MIAWVTQCMERLFYLAVSRSAPGTERERRVRENVPFIGRLAIYRYFNMDQVVGMALADFDRLKLE